LPSRRNGQRNAAGFHGHRGVGGLAAQAHAEVGAGLDQGRPPLVAVLGRTPDRQTGVLNAGPGSDIGMSGGVRSYSTPPARPASSSAPAVPGIRTGPSVNSS